MTSANARPPSSSSCSSAPGSLPDGYVQQVPNTPGGGDPAVRTLLALDRPPTAIVTSSDVLAFGVLHGAHSLGRVVPDELSVVGFDDILLASHTVPALTTLRMPTAEIVSEGVRLAIALARDPGRPRRPGLTIFPPSLIVRESTAPPSARPLRITSRARQDLLRGRAGTRSPDRSARGRAVA